MLFKIVFIFGCFVLTTNARCNLTAEPLELIECLSFTSTIVLGLVKNDIQRVCKSASLIATCASGHLSDCIGQQIGQAAFKEIINLSINCCPDRNSPSCSIRDSVMQEQRCFSADSLVTLSDGKQKSIVDLQSGDSLLAYNDKTKKVLSTHLLTMLDFQPHQFGKIYQFTYIILFISFFLLAFFKQVITTTGRQLSLSSSHIVPTDKHGYVMAKNIRIGMNVYVMNDNGVLITETVSNV
ncbi:unnamed protein product, partial [Rotaria sp. Silwood2]